MIFNTFYSSPLTKDLKYKYSFKYISNPKRFEKPDFQVKKILKVIRKSTNLLFFFFFINT